MSLAMRERDRQKVRKCVLGECRFCCLFSQLNVWIYFQGLSHDFYYLYLGSEKAVGVINWCISLFLPPSVLSPLSHSHWHKILIHIMKTRCKSRRGSTDMFRAHVSHFMLPLTVSSFLHSPPQSFSDFPHSWWLSPPPLPLSSSYAHLPCTMQN